MSFEVTATKKRPQSFDALEGQDFVVSTLKNSIEQGRIAHAYLFSGPRGVGKTSSARLLAKALNCVHGPTASPCGVCDSCLGIANGNSLDVIEIDGASNTGVNDIRTIKEEVLFPPSSSRYKIYIIDEVHMLSQSAFNALLKTIEEPPEYVVFIFATTETQKVPATVRSRCQQFNFKLIPTQTIKDLLQKAADELGVKAEEDVLYWIAGEAAGSMRDAYTLFDQVMSFSSGTVTMEQIREKTGLAGISALTDIMHSVLSDRKESALGKIRELLDNGSSVENIVREFAQYFRNLLLVKEGIANQNILGCKPSALPGDIVCSYTEEQLEAALELFLELFRSLRYSINPEFELELAVSRLFRLKFTYSNTSVIEQLARLKNNLLNGDITPLNPALASQPDVAAGLPEPAEAEPVAEKPVRKRPEMASEPQAEPKREAEPKPEAVAEPEAAKEEKKTVNAELQSAVEVNIQEMQDVLPPGVEKVSRKEDMLVLSFSGRFYYNAALKDRDSIVKRIQEKAGKVQVVFDFSETLEKQRIQKEKEQKVQEEKDREQSEDKDLAADLIFAFDGRIVK